MLTFSSLITYFLVFLPGLTCVRWGPASNETLFQISQNPLNFSTIFSPNGQIMNVQLDSSTTAKMRPTRAKNRTYESIRDIINIDQEYPDEKYDYNDKPVTGIDADGNLTLNLKNLNNSKLNELNNEINGYTSSTPPPNTVTTPAPMALPQISDYGNQYYPSKPDCPRIPSPTLTPSIPGRPRYVKIEWRKMILPSSSGSPTMAQSSSSSPISTSSLSTTTTPSSHKVQLVIPNDFSPFYYRKLVDYGPSQSSQNHPPLMPIDTLHHHPPIAPPLPPPPMIKRNKKPSPMKFPNVFSGLMKKKKRPKPKRPGFIYIPGPPQATYSSPYYYGPVPLPEREPWPLESLVKFVRDRKNSTETSIRKTINYKN